MNKAIIGVFVIGMVILSGCQPQSAAPKVMESATESSNEGAMMEKEILPEEAQMEKEDAAMEKETMMEKDTQEYQGTHLGGTHETPYLAFTQDDYEKALEEEKIILLYFYASWCPNCVAEQPKAIAAFSEINDPTLIGFRVNYKDSDTDSSEEALARQFGITYQHTKVILKDGKQAQKSLNAWEKEDYLEALRTA
jgi:thiol-disulfide isomerase/thioredoxin